MMCNYCFVQLLPMFIVWCKTDSLILSLYIGVTFILIYVFYKFITTLFIFNSLILIVSIIFSICVYLHIVIITFYVSFIVTILVRFDWSGFCMWQFFVADHFFRQFQIYMKLFF